MVGAILLKRAADPRGTQVRHTPPLPSERQFGRRRSQDSRRVETPHAQRFQAVGPTRYGKHGQRRHSSRAPELTTPVLYLRGQQERGADVGVYTKGLEAAGVRSLQGVVVRGARHFTQEEAPAAVWEAIASFAARAAP